MRHETSANCRQPFIKLAPRQILAFILRCRTVRVTLFETPAAWGAMPTGGDTFVGRLRELEALGAALDQAIAGQGRIVMVAGEPGIGKTRTAQELAQFATQRGAAVLWGHCHEEAGAPSYWPWVQIIRGALRTAEARPSLEGLGSGAGDIADMVPEIHTVLPGIEPPARLEDAAQARFRMFDSIRQFIAALCGRQAVLIVLDDLHWADAPSLRLLEFLAPELAGNRVMLVGTYRPTELSRQHPLSDALGGLTRARHVTRIDLSGLSAEEVHAFITAATGKPPPDWLSRSLYRQTEGNPLFLREIVRFLEHQGLFRADRSVPLAALPPTIRIPEGVKEVIGRRLNLLSAHCNEMLALGAVIGRDFSHDLLLRAARQDEQGLNNALDEALGAHVIQETADRHYQFAHNLIRMTLYDELRPARRRQLHHAAGNALEVSHRADIGAALPELARHFLAAGDADKAIEYARRAGERAEALLAFEDAVELFQTALEGTEQRPQPDDAGRCRLLLLLGEALRKANDFPRALETLRQAADLATTLNLPEISARAAMAYEHAAWRHEKGTEPPPRHLLERALRQVADSEPVLAAEVTAALGRALWHEGAAAEAVRRGEQAIVMARRLGDPEVLATCLNCALFIFGDSESQELLPIATEAVAAASQIGNLELVYHARGWRFMAFMEHGEIAQAETELEAAAPLVSLLRQSTYAFTMTMYRVMLALMRGKLADAERRIAQAMAMTSMPVHQEQLSVPIFSLRREQGRLGELRPVLSAFLGQIGPSSIWRPGLALLHLELDEPDAARIVFEQMANAGFAAIPRDGRWLLCMSYLCEACSELGDAARAAGLYELMRPYSGRNLLAGRLICCGSADRHLGMLCATMRNWPDAERHFAVALAMNSRTGARTPLAHTQYDFAAMLLARKAPGDRERADALLRACLETARELGMRRLKTKAAGLLTEQPSARPPSGAIDDLTVREIEVLGLLTIGRSNADIALVLSISLSTVATHCRNIFAKTGCANRTEAAAYALRHGLASLAVH
jgi:DNA-binding CsgD family transcriptional regulator